MHIREGKVTVFSAGFKLVPHIWDTTPLYYLRWRGWTQFCFFVKEADLPQENKRKQFCRGSSVFRGGG